MGNDLIFDIGMNNGDDTAYYLACGYEVVAVEANPQFCESARGRFSTEVGDGRLTVRNIGISSHVGDLTFWVSERSEWSSFDKDLATRLAVPASPMTISTMRLCDLLNEYPPALYVKIDIEGSDSDAIRTLKHCSSPPSYISFEGHPAAATDIQLLSQLGYCAFKFVRQNDWRETTTDNMRWHSRKRKIRAFAANHSLLQKGLSHVRPRQVEANGWQFPAGSSGPLARELPGRWMDITETLAVVNHRRALDSTFEIDGPGAEWWDIHAARHEQIGRGEHIRRRNESPTQTPVS